MNIGQVFLNLWENSGFYKMTAGFLSEGGWQNLVMIVIACVLLYLAIVKKFEPLLLVGIAFEHILVLNGPNLNLLGKREPGIYGSDSMETSLAALQERFPQVKLSYYQSNVEGELINKLHEVGFTYDGIVFNAGAYTHTSVALHDAIKAINTPVVEVHISNVYQRETYRHTSLITGACLGVIGGFGMDSYRLAIEALLQL